MAKCPICGDPAEHAVHPFCSRRCADIDLGRWMTGRYAIAAVEEDTPDETTVLENGGFSDVAHNKKPH
jgi:endogenous inhibitor of DNA gyrase (YacG/DUF329 family)